MNVAPQICSVAGIVELAKSAAGRIRFGYGRAVAGCLGAAGCVRVLGAVRNGSGSAISHAGPGWRGRDGHLAEHNLAERAGLSCAIMRSIQAYARAAAPLLEGAPFDR